MNVATKMVLPDGTTQYYDYNYWGQIEEQGYLDSDNQKYGIVTSTYNTIGELLSTTGEDDSGSSYTYNLFGDITQVVDDSGTRTFTYDNAGRLTNESGANGNKAYTYDLNGNRIGFSLAENNQTIQEQTYVYDRLNRLTQVKDSNNNILASYTYDDNSNLTTETKGEDVVTQYTYNYGSQLTGKTNVVGGTVVSDYDYTYYLDGNIKTENNRTFTYDNLGRLKQESDGADTISYSYDRFGNRTSMNNSGVFTSYTYDLNNRLLQEVSGNKTTFYNYDDRGNLYSKRTDEQSNATDLLKVDFFGELKNNADSTVELYFYNGLNRLEEVRKGGITAQYTYNAEGIRTSKIVNGVTTAFYLDGANVIAESVNGNTTNYVRGVSGIVYSEVLGSGNSRKYYTSDGHGNITNLINTSGSVVKSYIYDAFGVEENIDSTDTNPFRYCGEYYDSEINQIYLRARYYSPELGRFNQQDTYWNPQNMIFGGYLDENNLSPDIASIKQSCNLYIYCRNNPINLIDPTGDYDRKAAVAYAMRYGNASYLSGDRNDFYYNYTTNCANFVSQCLKAGGIRYTTSWYSHRNYKEIIIPSLWNNNNHNWDVSESWRLASVQFDYFSDPDNGYIWEGVLTIEKSKDVKEAATSWCIQPGDLLYLAGSDGKEIEHAMIVTKVENGEIYYAGNTREAVDKELSINMGNEQVKVIRIRNEAEYGYRV